MDQRELSLAVVGLGFPNRGKGKGNRRFEVRLCSPGEPVELRLEPKNPADPNAVAVFSARGIQIGYLTAERAPWIGGKIRAGEIVRAVFQEETATAAIIRARFGGDAPTLPPRREARPSWDDFTPDPEGPEWGA